jgi:GTP1/Obg family GTP-binding protein
MKTQWKDIPAVPTSQEFLDIVLSRTYVAKFFSATLCAHHTNVCYTTN